MNTKVEASMRGDGVSGTRNTRPEEGRNFRINQKRGVLVFSAENLRLGDLKIEEKAKTREKLEFWG